MTVTRHFKTSQFFLLLYFLFKKITKNQTTGQLLTGVPGDPGGPRSPLEPGAPCQKTPNNFLLGGKYVKMV